MRLSIRHIKLALVLLTFIYLVILYFYLSAKIENAPIRNTYPSSITEVIDFSRPGYPSFLQNVHGLSGHESWGRWTDGSTARNSNELKFIFKEPLPNNFDLIITTKAFGPNINQPILIDVGNQKFSYSIQSSGLETHQFEVRNAKDINSIRFTIPRPTSPKSINAGSDNRLLGIGLVTMQIRAI